MGKASSSKKVAKAARAGGRASGVRQRNLLFPGVLGAVALLGLLLLVVARGDYQDGAGGVPPQNFEAHWHSAYGIYVCDEWVPAAENFDSTMGIHSHGDDLIHIHPTSRQAAGENAQLGVFTDESPLLELSDSSLTVGDDTWEEGEDTCEVDGDEVDGELVVGHWQDVVEDDEPAIRRDSLEDIRFRENGEGFVIAFVPEDETGDIPSPPSASALSAGVDESLDDIVPPDADQEFLDQMDPYGEVDPGQFQDGTPGGAGEGGGQEPGGGQQPAEPQPEGPELPDAGGSDG